MEGPIEGPRRPQDAPKSPQGAPRAPRVPPRTPPGPHKIVVFPLVFVGFHIFREMHKNLRKITILGGPAGVPEASWDPFEASWGARKASGGLLRALEAS